MMNLLKSLVPFLVARSSKYYAVIVDTVDGLKLGSFKTSDTLRRKVQRKLRHETMEARQLMAADLSAAVNQDLADSPDEMPVIAHGTAHATNEGIVNGSFEEYDGTPKRGWQINHNVQGWYGVNAGTVNPEVGVNPDTLPSSEGIELWHKIGEKSYAGQNKIELDGYGNVVDGVYQKFSTAEATNLMFTAYARQKNSSDIEVYIDGEYVETVTPPTANRGPNDYQAYFYKLEAGEHSILFKEVNGQSNGRGAVIDNVRLVSDEMKMMLDESGRHTHNFHEHVTDLFGEELMAPGQTEYDAKGFEKVSDKLYQGNSPITGLRPIIEEAIDREVKRNPKLSGEALERKIANRLTNLNDFNQLQTSTQDKLIEMTGIDFRAMTKEQREHTINHLQHSPIPFGAIEEVLTPDTVIDLGFTHTLDKNYTRVSHEGEGVWKVWIISNNNNGSHTGHNLGEFKVQLSADLTANQARDAANRMIKNTNNNNKLSLDEAAKDILYGVTPRIDAIDRDAPVNEGIVNGSFEEYDGTPKRGWQINHNVQGWYGVNAGTVNPEVGVNPDTLPSSEGIELWHKIGEKSYAGQNKIELDGYGNVVDGVYQKFSTAEATNLMFTAYARQKNSSDIEVYIDGEYVETVTPPTANRGPNDYQAYFYKLEAGEHSILFKEVNGQSNGRGAVIDNVRLVSDEMKMMLDESGRHTHNFHEHVTDLFGEELMAPGQTEYDAKGFEKVSDKLYQGNSPITGLRPIIEEAIDREVKRNPKLSGEALERKIANRLTNLNDFNQLQTSTQDKLIEMTGIDFRAMTKEQREHTINHLQHSPIPFGAIEEVLTPDTVIDLGFTHTLDKNYTRVSHEGEGVWKVWIISNNNNGSHTGHNLGEFKVQLSADLTANQARDAANRMIKNTNNNNKLSLDEAAKDILYGVTPRIDDDGSAAVTKSAEWDFGGSYSAELHGDAEVSDGSLILDGRGDYAESDPVTLDGSFSITATANLQSTKGWQTIAAQSGSWNLKTRNGQLVFTTPGIRDHFSKFKLEEGRDYEITVTFDALRDGGIKFYVDGDLIHEGNASNFRPNQNAVTIGMNHQWGQFWNGTIDQVEILDGVLSAAEIQAESNVTPPMALFSVASTETQYAFAADAVFGSDEEESWMS